MHNDEVDYSSVVLVSKWVQSVLISGKYDLAVQFPMSIIPDHCVLISVRPFVVSNNVVVAQSVV